MDNKIFKDSLLSLTNRSTLSLTGVEKVIEVSEKQLSLEVGGSFVTIDGSSMTVQKLDVENGIIDVKGIVDCIKYHNKKDRGNFLKRIFK